ncbi:MAG: hypothetical protein NC201_06860 [Prevotella sp.]|nr:hypothetical protein [Bacteroides sp.]MCM1366948.1 hypothetical protein [Prevotella sp.]MCM1437168.1 hypothetical protein [Prevotella sp.]
MRTKFLLSLSIATAVSVFTACGPKTVTETEKDTARVEKEAAPVVQEKVDSAAIKAAQEEEAKAVFAEQEKVARDLYGNVVLGGSNSKSVISRYCTSKCMKAMQAANEYDDGGYAVWVLRTEHQDGSGPSVVTSITPDGENAVLVKYKDMGYNGSTRLLFVKEGDKWKVNGATTAKGRKIL